MIIIMITIIIITISGIGLILEDVLNNLVSLDNICIFLVRGQNALLLNNSLIFM